MLYKIFLSSQVKRWAIITYKHGIYELPHELPKDIRVRKYLEIVKTSLNDSLVPSPRVKMNVFLKLVKNS